METVGAANNIFAVENAEKSCVETLEPELLDCLLLDRSSGKNIIWATDTYADLGPGFEKKDHIERAALASRFDELFSLRAARGSFRTRKHGEVFTPLSIVRQMCDVAHETLWDGDWKKYVAAKVMEIACGEAPFLVSVRDLASGDEIPLDSRPGLLDRKLRVVNENAKDSREWSLWSVRAFQSTYAYELQGDNLFLARLNFLRTYEDFFRDRWGYKPFFPERRKIAAIISSNVWQMDGLTGTIPHSSKSSPFLSFLPEDQTVFSEIRDWNARMSYVFNSLKQGRKMKFDFIIGNPPYQEESVGDQKTFSPPVYHSFMDEAYKLADKVELIHPARFLFNAGSTPKEWNRKMLNSENFKILSYILNSKDIFPYTDIKGGIAISYNDKFSKFNPIKVFTKYNELNYIINKIPSDFVPLSKIAVTSYAYHFTDDFHKDFPEARNLLSAGHQNDLKSNVFQKLTEAFNENLPNDSDEYIKILGRLNNERIFKFIKKKYINNVINLYKYKVFLAGANGAGALGEVLSSPIIGNPGEGATETFLSIGSFDNINEAHALLKYIKSKFARIMLGILKTTQALTPQKWDFVPLQDFTSNSDIDWSTSIPEIDRQLYAKYGLDEKEIQFIESRVKEMA